jgi:hypothetical protein
MSAGSITEWEILAFFVGENGSWNRFLSPFADIYAPAAI